MGGVRGGGRGGGEGGRVGGGEGGGQEEGEKEGGSVGVGGEGGRGGEKDGWELPGNNRFAHTSSLSIEPLGSNGIDFINEDNRRGILSCKSEYVPYHTRPLAQIFLHEF